MKLLRHIAWWLGAAMVAAALLTSCVYDDYAEEELPDGGDRRTVWLSLHTGIVGAPTRAGEDGTPDIERMHSLRVVLLDADGKVEYNDYISEKSRPDLLGNNGLTGEFNYGEKYRIIRTTTGKKHIYFIANEESVINVNGGNTSLTALLDGIKVDDSSQAAEEKLNTTYFTPDNYENWNIPLSSYYEFEVGEEDLGRRIEKYFWLVRAATKFEFRFENYRGSAVQIEELKISSIANDMYLMANLDEDEKNKPLPGSSDSDKVYWIDWLQKVAEDTTAKPENPENENINKDYGWITGYSLPNESNNTDELHQVKTIVKAQDIGDNWTISAATTNNTANNLTPGKLEGLPAVYFPESKFKETTIDNETRQNYTLSITVRDLTEEQAQEFPDVKLENLKALFRNTHVIVTMVFDHEQKGIQLNLRIGICPWDEEGINIPPFD